MRTLKPQEARELLDFLSLEIGSEEGNIKEEEAAAGWICSLIDAQMSVFVLGTEALQTLTDLSQKLREERGLVKEMRSIKPLLEQLKTKSSLPRQPVAKYQIEYIAF